MNCWSSSIFICVILNVIQFLIHSLYGWRKWLNRKSVAEKNEKRKPEPLSESYRMLTSGGSQKHRYKACSTTVHCSPFTRLHLPVPVRTCDTCMYLILMAHHGPLYVKLLLILRMKSWRERCRSGLVSLHILPNWSWRKRILFISFEDLYKWSCGSLA